MEGKKREERDLMICETFSKDYNINKLKKREKDERFHLV